MNTREFLDDIKEIARKYVGRCDKHAYASIRAEIEEYLNDMDFAVSCYLQNEAGVLYYDTTENNEELVSHCSNIGKMEVLTYQIVWKYRKGTHAPTGTILDIIFKEMPRELIENDGGDVINLPQVLNFHLAKENKRRLDEELDELEESYLKRKLTLQEMRLHMVDIMRSECYSEETQQLANLAFYHN